MQTYNRIHLLQPLNDGTLNTRQACGRVRVDSANSGDYECRACARSRFGKLTDAERRASWDEYHAREDELMREEHAQRLAGSIHLYHVIERARAGAFRATRPYALRERRDDPLTSAFWTIHNMLGNVEIIADIRAQYAAA